ncbi:MAG: RHS repeat protein [Gammaproteobacteria bacterium]|nr:RHS repeat protein [Gammaproteobacteria bacterium]
MIKVTDPAGGITEYTYDTANRMLTVKNPRGIIEVTNEYDVNGRVSKQTHGDGGVYLFAYTLNGGNGITQTTVTDPLGGAPDGHKDLCRFDFASGRIHHRRGGSGVIDEQFFAGEVGLPQAAQQASAPVTVQQAELRIAVSGVGMGVLILLPQ